MTKAVIFTAVYTFNHPRQAFVFTSKNKTHRIHRIYVHDTRKQSDYAFKYLWSTPGGCNASTSKFCLSSPSSLENRRNCWRMRLNRKSIPSMNDASGMKPKPNTSPWLAQNAGTSESQEDSVSRSYTASKSLFGDQGLTIGARLITSSYRGQT